MALSTPLGESYKIPKIQPKITFHRKSGFLSGCATGADLNVCANCGISGDSKGVKLNSCSQCKAVKYCGKACQLKHWKEGGHKKVCCVAQP